MECFVVKANEDTTKSHCNPLPVVFFEYKKDALAKMQECLFNMLRFHPIHPLRNGTEKNDPHYLQIP